MGRYLELQNKHLVLFKSPRDVLQINTSSQQLDLGSQLKEWFLDATSVPHGHLLIDLTPKTVEILRYGSICGSVSTQFELPTGKRTEVLDDEYTKRLFSLNFFNKFPNYFKNNSFSIVPKIL